MADRIGKWIIDTFDLNPYLTTSILSLIPMVETRGGITVGIKLGLDPYLAWVFSCLSALIVCPVLLLFLDPILRKLKKTKFFGKIASSLEELFKGKAKKIEKDIPSEKTRKNVLKKMLGVFLFVAIPLPMTGVWTGSAVACFVDLDFARSLIAIIAGNFVSGLIIALLNVFLGDYAPIILLVLLVFILISVVSVFVGILRKNKKEKGDSV